MSNAWMSLQEAAEYLGVSTKTLRRRISEGTLKAYRVGKGPRSPLRLRRDDLDGLLVRVPSSEEFQNYVARLSHAAGAPGA